MAMLTYSDLFNACSPGGSSVLTSVTELAPAGGPHTAVAPAKFVSGNASVFAYETRFVDGEPLETVVIDSKQSQLNRVEQPLSIAIEAGDPLLSKVPRIRVSYDGASYTDLDLPHRAFDGHIRAGSLDEKPVTESAAYRAVRDASAANARALLETSPASLVFGAWDASRRSHQGRYRSALVGEIIGVLADQSENARTSPKRGGARVDPVAMSVQLTGKDLEAILEDQESELSAKTVEDIRKEACEGQEQAYICVALRPRRDSAVIGNTWGGCVSADHSFARAELQRTAATPLRFESGRECGLSGPSCGPRLERPCTV